MKRLDDNSDLLKILRCAFETYNTLKSGYLESVYEAALEYELLQAGLQRLRVNRETISLAGLENDSSTRPTGLSSRGETPVPRPILPNTC